MFEGAGLQSHPDGADAGSTRPPEPMIAVVGLRSDELRYLSKALLIMSTVATMSFFFTLPGLMALLAAL
jgi:hypothetical protein